LSVKRFPFLVLASLAAGCVMEFGALEDAGALPDGEPVDLVDGGPPDADPADAAPLTQGLSTLAGADEAGFQDGARNVARFNNPVNLVVAEDGDIYVADFNNGAIRKVTDTGTVTTLVSGDSRFVRPFGLAFGPDGALYVQTDKNTTGQATGALWRVNPRGGSLELLHDDFGRTRGMGVISDGRVVMCDYQAHVLRVWDPRTHEVTLLAGKEGEAGFANGKGERARFNVPYDVVVGPSDTLYVTDQENHRIRFVTMEGAVSTWIGADEAVSVDGPVAQARFVKPQGLARDRSGVIYVSDPFGHYIRRIGGGQVTTVAGNGEAGYVDKIDPTQASFFGLEGIDVTPEGDRLYIADGDLGEDLPYHRVRRLQF
jgi:sugar lactone lactonase YvrE